MGAEPPLFEGIDVDRIGKGKDSSPCLVDVKEGVTAAAPTVSKVAMPRDNAVRVVTGAKALSPNLGERMMAARLLGKAVVVRELMPQDLKIEVNRLSREEAMSVARYLGGVVGRAHGRQMEPGQRRAWRADLTKNHKASLDAPSWLWAGVVELIPGVDARVGRVGYSRQRGDPKSSWVGTVLSHVVTWSLLVRMFTVVMQR